MSSLDCRREDELLAALGRGFVAPELERHAATCAACGELRLVAGTLLDDRAGAIAAAPVPSAGTMWWRMRVRQRQEAMARARRSLLIGQAVTLAVALTLVGLLFGADLVAGLRDLAGSVRIGTPALVALGISALVAPLAGWIALRQE
ncbi:MAG TPA: hypothetical protein VM617_05565 [Thermoanaerobaculia bacterium]|nr:hypothetical protein [Thermoanaerobaculia bacterium]